MEAGGVGGSKRKKPNPRPPQTTTWFGSLSSSGDLGSICSVFCAYVLQYVQGHRTDEITDWNMVVLLESLLYSIFQCLRMGRTCNSGHASDLFDFCHGIYRSATATAGIRALRTFWASIIFQVHGAAVYTETSIVRRHTGEVFFIY